MLDFFRKIKKTPLTTIFVLMLLFMLIPEVTQADHSCPEGQQEIHRPVFSRGGTLLYYTDFCDDEKVGETENTVKGNETGISDALGFLANITIGPILTAITSLIFVILGLLLKLSGVMMDAAIQITVYEMADYIKIDGVKAAWTIIRNFLNIGFIFTFVYIGISTILQLGGGYKKLLSSLIMAALLVNFSFFFTGVLIDASNILTLSVYKEIQKVDVLSSSPEFGTTAEGGGKVNGFDPNQLGAISGDISSIFMQQTGITTIFRPTWFDATSAIIVAVFGSIFLVALIFGFFFVALLLLLRVAILLVLIVTSPIGVIGSSFPGLGSYSSQWWKSLWGQLVFAPLYMVLTLVVALIITSPDFTALMNISNGANWATAIMGGFSTDSVGLFINYLLITTFLIASIAISKSVATMGGGVISDLVGKAGQAAGGVFGFAGRNTLGRGAHKLAESQGLQNVADDKSRSWATRFAARQLIFGSDKVRKSSFDARATGFGGDIAPMIGAGKATGKGGREKYVKDKAKAIDEKAKLLGELSEDQIKAHPEHQALTQKHKEALEKAPAEKKEKLEKEHKKEMAELEQKLKLSRQTDYVKNFNIPDLKETGVKIDKLTTEIKSLEETMGSLGTSEEDEKKKEEHQEKINRLKEERAKLEPLVRPMVGIKRFFQLGSGRAAGAKLVNKRTKKSDKDKIWEELEEKIKESSGGGGESPKDAPKDKPEDSK